MALNDIWEARVTTRVQGEDTYNVFHYVETTAETAVNPEVALANAWVVTMSPLVAALLGTQHELTAVDVSQVTGGAAIYTAVMSVFGSNTSEGMPRFVAYTYRLNRASSSGRHGYKRFAGVVEAANLDGTLNPSFNTVATALATGLTTPLQWTVGGGTGVFTPKILSRFINGQPRVTPIAQDIASAVFVSISTQNTRK